MFVLAGLCETGGGHPIWGHVRQDRSLAWALVGAAFLALNGVVAAFQPLEAFGRVYAAYGGVFVALSVAWGVLAEGFAQTGMMSWAPSSSFAAF